MRTWRQDLDRSNAAQAREALIAKLTADLTINSSVAMTTVDDPTEKGKTQPAVRSLRDDPLAGMYSRSQIDSAQFQAGRYWQKAYEGAEIGSVRAIDTTKEAVDGGRFFGPDTDKQSKSLADLNASFRELGKEGSAIVRDILGARMSIKMAAASRGLTSKSEQEYIGRRFRECLETLAILWGYAPGKKRRA